MSLEEKKIVFKIDLKRYRAEINHLWDSDRKAAKRLIKEYTRPLDES